MRLTTWGDKSKIFRSNLSTLNGGKGGGSRKEKDIRLFARIEMSLRLAGDSQGREVPREGGEKKLLQEGGEGSRSLHEKNFAHWQEARAG